MTKSVTSPMLYPRSSQIESPGVFPKVMSTVAVAFAICLVSSVRADAPKFLWAQRAGGTNEEYETRIAVDSAGNSYAIGKFSGPTMPIGGFILTNGGLFIAKYDIMNTVIWARQIGPASHGQGSASGDRSEEH